MNETVAEISEELRNDSAVQRHWLKVQSSVVYSDLSRSKLYQLIDEGAIRSVCLRDPDNVRGTRLINRASLDAYLCKHENLKSEPVPGRKGRKSKREKESETL